jgi:hypothetical protein
MPQAICTPLAPTLAASREERPMTFQVTLIGSDGVIVGSDRKQIHYTPSAPGALGALQPDLITKFSRSKNDDVVCAYAGESSARSIADAIVSLPECSMKVTDFEWRIAIKKAGESVQERGPQDEVIVIRKDTLKRAYLANSYSAPTEVCSCISTGNHGYPARFLLCHFYEKLPIAELRKLALLTLHCASIESEGRIGGGFDLMLWKEGGIPDFQPIEENNPSIAAEWEAIRQFVHSRVYPN